MAAIPGVLTYGGFGQAAYGRCQLGTPSSDIGPRFYTSKPSDGTSNVARDVWLEFYTYYYSSVPAFYGPAEVEIAVEISEDGGDNYNDASIAPYALTIKPFDGQRYWTKIVKTGLWADNEEIVIRYTGIDEHGNPSTKEVPVIWS